MSVLYEVIVRLRVYDCQPVRVSVTYEVIVRLSLRLSICLSECPVRGNSTTESLRLSTCLSDCPVRGNSTTEFTIVNLFE